MLMILAHLSFLKSKATLPNHLAAGDKMAPKKKELLLQYIGIIIAIIPIIGWMFVFYSNSQLMAANIDDLQNEKKYIRSSLEQIITKLARIEGTIEEHLITDRPTPGCTK